MRIVEDHSADPPPPRLRESHFLRLLEVLPAAAYTCDPEGRITWHNESAASLWGRRPKLDDPLDLYCGSFKLFSAQGEPVAHRQCWMARALHENTAFNEREIVVERLLL